jgi:hypothetical protein
LLLELRECYQEEEKSIMGFIVSILVSTSVARTQGLYLGVKQAHAVQLLLQHREGPDTERK